MLPSAEAQALLLLCHLDNELVILIIVYLYYPAFFCVCQ